MSAHVAMGRRIDSSWWTHLAISRSSHNSTTGMYYTVCGMMHIKEPILLIGMAKAGTCARDRRALQQIAMNVHVKHFDLT